MAECRQHPSVGGSSRRRWRGHIETKIGNPTFRATAITAYLENGGTLEKAATMANHASASTMLSWS
jgi:integrase/recombinase XerC